MFAFRIDEPKQLVHVEIGGLMSPSEVDALNEGLLANSMTARRTFGAFRLLVDARESPVQPAATMVRFKAPAEFLRGQDDRYAVVVGSMLSKLQADRVCNDDRSQAFLSIEAAEDWLSASMPAKAPERRSTAA